MTDTATRPRRRNPGVTGADRMKREENALVRVSKQIADAERAYAERNELVLTLYDSGYTHRQIAALVEKGAGEAITYDAIGRIVRLARADGRDI